MQCKRDFFEHQVLSSFDDVELSIRNRCTDLFRCSKVKAPTIGHIQKQRTKTDLSGHLQNRLPDQPKTQLLVPIKIKLAELLRGFNQFFTQLDPSCCVVIRSPIKLVKISQKQIASNQ